MRIMESPRPDASPPFVNRKYLSGNVFNWTWSYRKDSDIYQPHGYDFFPKGVVPPGKFWKPVTIKKYNLNK